ncbi:hypothetical protein G9A89_018306 [Geosiphon pyriformis]|nr:hypothetical protein G9A89_018306 [Geosiphon pyriformis]
MKNALDKSIEDGVNDMIICGFQIIGFLGRAYVMDLLFDGHQESNEDFRMSV